MSTFPLLSQINESIDDATEAAARLIKAIEMCPELAELPSNRAMFRGYNSNAADDNTPVLIKQLRTDRQPRDVNQKWHRLFNDYFVHKFGIPFRSAAFFVSGDVRVAEHYGTPYIFIPAPRFKFCWSTMIDDPANEVDLLRLPPEGLSDLTDDDTMRTYTSDNLGQAIESGHEIMVHCQYATLLNTTISPDELAVLVSEVEQLGHQVGNCTSATELYHKLVVSIYSN